METISSFFFLFNLSHSTENILLVSILVSFLLITSVLIFGFFTLIFEKIEIFLIKEIFGIKFALIFRNYITFPGTFIHELSHGLFCLLTGAELVEICVFENNENRLGHVSYKNRGPFFLRAIQDSLIASAPTIIGSFLLVLCGFLLLYIELLLWQKISLIYLIISLLNHSSMSSVDLKIYLKSCWIFIVPLTLFCFIFLKFQFNQI